MTKSVLITGASSGLGEGMAKEFAKLGYRLMLCARREEMLVTLRAGIIAEYPDVEVLTRVLDVNDHDDVFTAFKEAKKTFGHLDRVIVNAGIGNGVGIGKGGFSTNLRTFNTNLIAALAQCEAAIEIFREQGNGHLVTISSMSALRGMRGAMTAYAASKAALANLTEGIRLDLYGSDIKVSTIYPGYILTDLNKDVKNAPFRVDLATGCKAMVKAIEKEVDEAYVPRFPWVVLGFVMKRAPLRILRKLF